jgi:propanol-preferring alcohol dehydrogenase
MIYWEDCKTMKALVLKRVGPVYRNSIPLDLVELPDPEPGEGEVLIQVQTCGVCHTELDIIEGRTPPPQLPVVLGHQVIGRISATGPQVTHFQIGDRVGVGWINSTCGECESCLQNNENLCPGFKATGRDVNGGYAQLMTIHEDFAYLIPDNFTDLQAAPLFCAGAIGYRSLSLSGLQDGQNLGLTGFGASGHLVLHMVKHRYPGVKVFVFARSAQERKFAVSLGAVWAGDIPTPSPEPLHCIIDTTPVWKPIVKALNNLKPGGRLIINAIRKEEIDKDYLLHLDYTAHLWMEKEIKSVANVSRSDIREFLKLAAEIPIIPEVQECNFMDANTALKELKMSSVRGAKVLRIST